MFARPALYYHVPLELAALRRMGITQSMSRRGQQGHACTGPHKISLLHHCFAMSPASS